jgi:hypothetical protein
MVHVPNLYPLNRQNPYSFVKIQQASVPIVTIQPNFKYDETPPSGEVSVNRSGGI